jgi:hypothetical protein
VTVICHIETPYPARKQNNSTTDPLPKQETFTELNHSLTNFKPATAYNSITECIIIPVFIRNKNYLCICGVETPFAIVAAHEHLHEQRLRPVVGPHDGVLADEITGS